ncbi:MAG: histidine kinase [Phycisphaerae bacterium]|nr:histidine kinase [Saprospiraceae bacterium]
MTTVFSDKLNDKYLRLWGIPLISLSGLLALMRFYFEGRWDLFGWYFLGSVIYTTFTWEICRWILKRVRRRIPGLEYTKQRLVLTFIFFMLVAGIGNVFVKLTFLHFGLKPPSMANKSFFEWWLINFPSILFFVLLLSCIYEAIYFFDQYKFLRQKAQLLRKQQAQQQLDALKTRVNPHFLFNSLTTLSALIGEDPQRAEHFVDELSKVYRYLLKAGRQSTAALGEELQFAASYSFLLKSRFEEGAFTFSDGRSDSKASRPSESLDRNIPLLTLQYALDYLVRTQNTPLHIQIYALENQLRIACENHPKTLSFDVDDNDWRQLESNGAQQEIQEGQLAILIPFTPDPLKK